MTREDKPNGGEASVTEPTSDISALGRLDAGDRSAFPPLDAGVQAHIGRRLKAAYGDVLNQPVPERFRLLLEELDRKTGANESPLDGDDDA